MKKNGRVQILLPIQTIATQSPNTGQWAAGDFPSRSRKDHPLQHQESMETKISGVSRWQATEG